MADSLVRAPIAWRPLLAIAGVRFALPMLSTLLVPLGYTADEFYYLACAERLAFGYVDHPPFSIALLAAVDLTLGDSLAAVRVIPALCEAAAVIITGLLARELGGRRAAQVVAALAWAAAPIPLAVGFFYSMNAIEHALWPLVLWLLARLQNGADHRLWLAVGCLLGVALLNKLSTLWLGFGIAVGLMATVARHALRTRWPWAAAAIALVFLLPHVVWQVLNDWPTVEFVRNNATGRVGADAAIVMDSPVALLGSQLVGMGPFAAPIWLAGLVRLFRSREQRLHAWIFVAAFGVLALSGRGTLYYLAGLFPALLAAGAVALERSGGAPRWLRVSAVALVVQGLLVLPFGFPLVGTERYLSIARGARTALGAEPEPSLPPLYEYMLGAPELVAAVATAAERLSPAERASAGVLATTFGEAGALRHFGPAAGLPPVIGTHNSFGLWGPGAVDGEVLIVVADEDAAILGLFETRELAARVRCDRCEPTLRDRAVFVCRKPIRPLRELWPELVDYV